MYATECGEQWGKSWTKINETVSWDDNVTQFRVTEQCFNHIVNVLILSFTWWDVFLGLQQQHISSAIFSISSAWGFLCFSRLQRQQGKLPRTKNLDCAHTANLSNTKGVWGRLKFLFSFELSFKLFKPREKPNLTVLRSPYEQLN